MSAQQPGSDWYSRAPVPVVGLVMGVLMSAALALLDLLTGGDVDRAEVLSRLATFTVVYTAVVWWSRRRARVPEVPAADRAVRTAELPADTAPEVLRAGLLHVKRSLRRSEWTAYGLTGVLLVVVAVAARDDDVAGMAVAGALVLAVGLGCVLFVRLRMRRIERLLARLDAQPVG